MNDIPVFPIESCVMLNSNDYYPYILGAMRNAKARIWATIFIVDTFRDPDRFVRRLLNEMAYARWRYVDTRLLIGNSSISTISIGNETSRQYSNDLGIRCRSYVASQGNRSLHSKYAIIDDDLIVIGSHNWTSRAFASNQEASIAAHSSSLTRILAREFSSLWQATEE